MLALEVFCFMHCCLEQCLGFMQRFWPRLLAGFDFFFFALALVFWGHAGGSAAASVAGKLPATLG